MTGIDGQGKPKLDIIAWRPIARGALVGWVSVRLPSGLALYHCPVFRAKNSHHFVGLPRLPLMSGTAQIVDDDGEPQFRPVASWRDGKQANRFSVAVIALLRERYPDDDLGGRS